MGRVVFVGLGLNTEKGMTLEGLEEAQKADRVFAEFYTNPMPNLDLAGLEQKIGCKIQVLTRKDLEEDNAKEMVRAADKANIAFLVPGDPMVATTHVALRLTLAKQGIHSRIIHGPSIMSAVCGATGLQSYKFGKSITIPQGEAIPPSVLDAIRENMGRGLHTLLLIDLTQTGEPLSLQTVLARMVKADASINQWLAVGAARIGSQDTLVQAGKVDALQKVDFGAVPHCIVVPGRLHFMEEEALKVLDGATPADLETKE